MTNDDPCSFPSDTVTLTFRFREGIPSATAAAALKFGFEAVPGVVAVHFVGLDDVDVVHDADRTSLEHLWKCIVDAGFAIEMVTLGDEPYSGGSAGTVVSAGILPESEAA